jgi:hypothetical protein
MIRLEGAPIDTKNEAEAQPIIDGTINMLQPGMPEESYAHQIEPTQSESRVVSQEI